MIILKEKKEPFAEEENLEENLKVEEMATLYKRESGLPANLCLDDLSARKTFLHYFSNTAFSIIQKVSLYIDRMKTRCHNN
jgi:hypothetical protein